MSDDPTIDEAFFRCGMINSICAAHKLETPLEGKLLYEDEYVMVEAKGGEYIMTGKPIRNPFQYITVKGIS